MRLGLSPIRSTWRVIEQIPTSRIYGIYTHRFSWVSSIGFFVQYMWAFFVVSGFPFKLMPFNSSQWHWNPFLWNNVAKGTCFTPLPTHTPLLVLNGTEPWWNHTHPPHNCAAEDYLDSRKLWRFWKIPIHSRERRWKGCYIILYIVLFTHTLSSCGHV